MAKKKKQKESKYEQKFASDAIIEGISDSVCITDLKGNIIAVNKTMEELFQMPREKLSTMKGSDLAVKEDVIKTTKAVQNLIKTGLPQRVEVTGNLGKARGRAYWMSMALLRDEKGEAGAIVTVTRDITGHERMEEELRKAYDRVGKEVEERTKELLNAKEDLEIQAWGLKKTNEGIRILYKELEEKNKELQRLNELKDEFLSTVSHELATPLTIIKEGVRLVSDEMLGKVNEQQKEFLTIASNNVDRLTRLIVDLLDISKIEAGEMEIKKTSIDIKSLMRKLVSSFELKVEQKKLELRVNVPEEETDIYADEHRITQVFSNLVDNAIKFTEEGCIEISVKDEGNEVKCCVADTGIGISRKDIPKLFDKFTQFGRKPGPGEKGTGLGLAISSRIVELHGGRMWVESQPGRGSKFYFSLPKLSSQEKKKRF